MSMSACRTSPDPLGVDAFVRAAYVVAERSRKRFVYGGLGRSSVRSRHPVVGHEPVCEAV